MNTMNDDFEKGCKWTFGNPGENTQDEGPNNASSETFKEDPYSSLVRESIQNSLDAVADPNQAVRVSFEIGSIRPKAYPGFFELQQDIQECIESFKGKAEQAYGNALSLLESFRNNPNKSLYFIKISDSNTKGMEYKEGDTSSRFYSFVRSIGVSNKDNTSAGGSFGFGKAAYFNISPIRSILVSTLTWKGQYVFEGIASLCTHYQGNKKKASVGYYDNREGKPVTEAAMIPDKFRRKDGEAGTDIYIMGIDFSEKTESEVAEAMEMAVLRNFWLSILWKKLEVSIRYASNDGKEKKPECLDINAENIQDRIAERFGTDTHDKKQGRGNDNYNPVPYLTAVTGAGDDRSDCFLFKDHLPLLGETLLYVYKNPDAKNRITYMRKPLMKVIANKFPDFNGGKFYAVFICSDPKGNEKLRKMENPAHNKWDPSNWKTENQIDSHPDAKKVEKEYQDFIRSCLDKVFPLNHGQTLDIEGLEEFLYIPTSLENDIRQEHKHESAEAQADTVEPQARLNSEKPRMAEPKPLSVGKVFVNQEAKALYTQKGDFFSGHSSQKSRSKGGGAGSQSLSAASREDENGTPGTYAKAIPIRYRAYATTENGITYHHIILYADQEIPNGRIDLLIGGEQDDERVSIKDSSLGRPSGNSIFDLHIPQSRPGKPNFRLKIRLGDNMKHAIKLDIYERQ